jgi:hypothetical protein
MKRLIAGLLLSVLVGGAANAAGTTAYTITSTTFVDLGAAPIQIQTLDNPVVVVVADSQPTVGAVGAHLANYNPATIFYPADASSHVWAALLGSTAHIVATPVYSTGGGGGSGGAVTQGTTPWVDAVTQWAGGVLGAMANYGTSPGAVLVPGVNAFVTNAVAVSAASGSYLAGAFAVGSGTDGWWTTGGTEADAAYAGSGSATLVSILKGIYTALGTLNTTAGNPAAAGTNIIGKVGVDQTTDGTTNAVSAHGAVNVTPTDCSISLTAGGTAQNIIAASATIHGFTLANIDNTSGSGEPVWFSLTGTAVAAAAASWPLAAPTATTYGSLASYTTPLGFGSNHAVSVIAATTGHKISCTYW